MHWIHWKYSYLYIVATPANYRCYRIPTSQSSDQANEMGAPRALRIYVALVDEIVVAPSGSS